MDAKIEGKMFDEIAPISDVSLTRELIILIICLYLLILVFIFI